MKDIDISLETVEVSNRDYTDPINLNTDINIKEYTNKVNLEDILKFLPRKILVNDKVFTILLEIGDEECLLSYFSNIDQELDENNLKLGSQSPEEKILNPTNPWRFYKEYLGYIILHITKILATIKAVEVDENLKLVGNAKIIKSYDILSEYLKEPIKDYKSDYEELKNK